MKILYVCRLYSGFEESLISGVWNPKGAPTIARMIEALDTSADYELNIILTQKSYKEHKFEGLYHLEGLNTPIKVLAGFEKWPSWMGRFRHKFADFYQLTKIFMFYLRTKPELVYCDRVNIFPAVVLSRFFKAHVIWRIMGILEEMHSALYQDNLRSKVLKWFWKSPFKAVICTLDGSGGGEWMEKAIRKNIPQHLLLNGISKDIIPQDIELPRDKIKVLFVGRLESLKGIEEFLDAFIDAVALNSDLVALIAGDGSMRADLESKLDETGLRDRVIFLGNLSRSELKCVRQHSDFYVSLNKQGNLSNTNLEALSDSLPAIVPLSQKKYGIDKDTDSYVPQDVFYRFGNVGDKQALLDAINYMSAHENRAFYRNNAERHADGFLIDWQERIERELSIFQKSAKQTYDVAIVISDLGSGGAQKVAVSLASDLVSQNKKIAVVTLSTSEKDFLEIPDGVLRIALDLQNKSNNFAEGIFSNFKRIFVLRSTLKMLQSATVISFIAPTNILCIAATRGLNTNVIISERNDPARQSFGRLWDFLRKFMYRFADEVTANSINAVDTMRSYVPSCKLHYVPNALSKPSPEYVVPYGKKQKIILTVGRLHVQKAQHVLLDAFAIVHQSFPEWRLQIAGEGYLKEQLIEQAKSLQIDHVVDFLGVVKNPYEHYVKAKIFVLPSLYEGTPNSLLEAISCGIVPVISDTCLGARPYVVHEESGLIFPVGDVMALARSLILLIEDENKAEKYGLAALEKVSPLLHKTTLDLWSEALKI